MYLKREPPKFSSATALRKRFPFHKEAARKDSAVHVSLSSDSIFKQPGDLAVSTPRYAGKSS
jgi:hypothetical protein